MSDDFETVVATAKAMYGDVVARAWEALVARTQTTNPAAIEATCDLQRRLVVAGAEWLAVCDEVLIQTATPLVDGAARTVSTLPDTYGARASAPAASPSAGNGRPPAIAAASAMPARPVQTAPPSDAAMTLTGAQSSYRIFPLILDSAPAHVQLVAMSFNGSEWHPISAWRRVYQQVIQSLQRSDPDRFVTLATTITMANGRPLFSRDRSSYMAPIDVGGGWFATGQMPTELILQRLRTLVDWWGLPRESLSVEVMPETPAPSAPHSDAGPSASATGEDTPLAAPAPEAFGGARVEDAATSAGAAPVATLADVEPPDLDAMAEPTAVAVDAGGWAAEDVFGTDAGLAETAAPVAAVTDTSIAAAHLVDASGADLTAAQETGAADDAERAAETALDANQAAVEAPLVETALTIEAQPADADTTTETSDEHPEEILLERSVGEALEEPDDTDYLAPDDEDDLVTDAINDEDDITPGVAPEPLNDPVSGTEARVGLAQPPAPQIAVDAPTTAQPVAGVPPAAVMEDEFTPPPVPHQSNIRWVKTINGTRLPLRPAADD